MMLEQTQRAWERRCGYPISSLMFTEDRSESYEQDSLSAYYLKGTQDVLVARECGCSCYVSERDADLFVVSRTRASEMRMEWKVTLTVHLKWGEGCR